MDASSISVCDHGDRLTFQVWGPTGGTTYVTVEREVIESLFGVDNGEEALARAYGRHQHAFHAALTARMQRAVFDKYLSPLELTAADF